MKKYIPFTQQPYCCVPTCVQMVMYRRGLPLIEQEEIAYELGLTVPESDSHLFHKVRTGKMPSSGWGTQIQEKDYSLQIFFDNYGLQLKFEIKNSFKNSDELGRYLSKLQGDGDTDVILCFDYGKLWGLNRRGGHVCVLERIAGSEVHIIDPERNVPKRRTVNINSLFKAIDFHGEHNSTGVWVIR